MSVKLSSHVLPLAIAQFRKDWPFMAYRLDSMRQKAQARGPACGDTPEPVGASAVLSSIPDGNHGDNNLTTGGGA